MRSMSTVSMRTRIEWIVAAALIGVVAAVAPRVNGRDTPNAMEPASIAPPVGMPGAPPTSPDGLRQRISEMENRLQDRPQDAGAAVLLADALLRQSRVTGDGRLPARADSLLTSVLKDTPGHYDALRLLGATYLSQHRFRDALEMGRRARDLRPDDAWNYGVIGDASLELGEYGDAFEAFDKMVALRPGAAVVRARCVRARAPGKSHRRAAGDGDGKAGDGRERPGSAGVVRGAGRRPSSPHGTTPRRGTRVSPRRLLVFQSPVRDDRPGQGDGRAWRPGRTLAIFLDQFARTPTLDLAARIGDLHAEGGKAAEAERYYQLAEELAGPAIAQTEAALSLFLAEHDRELPGGREDSRSRGGGPPRHLHGRRAGVGVLQEGPARRCLRRLAACAPDRHARPAGPGARRGDSGRTLGHFH